MITCKKSKITALATLVAIFFIFFTVETHAETVSMEISAVINLAASATQTHTLDFGTVTANPGGDAVTLNGSGGTKTTTDSTNGSTTLGAHTGEITITSSIVDGSIAATITFSAASVTLTGPGPNVTVSNFITQSETSKTLGASTTFAIGGILNIPTAFTPGTYSGTVDLIVAYS